MAQRRAGITWYSDTLTPGLMGFQVVMEEALEEIMEQAAKEVEDYAKTNAPWSDRTGDARHGLEASFANEGNLLAITLYHTVDYGIWLEVAHSGNWAIILPTIEHMGPIVMGALGTTMGVAGGLSG